jgi:hypothetical protein
MYTRFRLPEHIRRHVFFTPKCLTPFASVHGDGTSHIGMSVLTSQVTMEESESIVQVR